MTAINVILEHDKAHVFSDGGHHEGQVLRYIAPKVFALDGLNMVFAWSGVSYRAEHIMSALAAAGATTVEMLFLRLPAVLEGMRIPEPFSAIFVGVERGVSVGMIVERKMSGEVVTYRLKPWSTVKYPSTPVEFDIRDIAGSGVRMMQDQRDRHRIVAGYVQHTVIESSGIRSAFLRNWPDLVAGGAGITHALKIEDLTVDTIKFDNNATLGVASRSSFGALTIPNVAETPVLFSMMAGVTYSGTAGLSYGQLRLIITRTRGSDVVAVGQYYKTGNVALTLTIGAAGADQSSQNNDEYTLSSQTFSGEGGSIGVTSIIFKAVYRKK